MTPAFKIIAATGEAAPVIFDSPHSGSIYPADFDHQLDPILLRQAEDAHIEELFASVATMGAPLLHALFPRTYIDPNRDVVDIDIEMIEGGWPDPVEPTSKTLTRGMGLIWRRMRDFGDLYDHKLTVEDVRRRIDTCWRPYHTALSSLIDDAHARNGVSYHVNCHSMPARGDKNSEDGPVDRADFVIGDRDGTSCEPGLTALITDHLRAAGYDVSVNYPYKGVELVKRYSDPALGRHSIQLEINRRLFMDESSLLKTEGYLALDRDIETLCRAIIDYAKDQLRDRA